MFSVQTVHTESVDHSVDYASHSTPAAPLNTCPTKNCFVCGSSDVEYFVEMGRNLSIHSQTNIVEFIWKFLGNRPSIRADATNAAGLEHQVICNKCLCLIDKYDAANEVTKQLEKQLIDSLALMEANYAKAQNDVIPNTNYIDDGQQINEQDQNDTTNDMGVIDLCDDSNDL